MVFKWFSSIYTEDESIFAYRRGRFHVCGAVCISLTFPSRHGRPPFESFAQDRPFIQSINESFNGIENSELRRRRGLGNSFMGEGRRSGSGFVSEGFVDESLSEIRIPHRTGSLEKSERRRKSSLLAMMAQMAQIALRVSMASCRFRLEKCGRRRRLFWCRQKQG